MISKQNFVIIDNTEGTVSLVTTKNSRYEKEYRIDGVLAKCLNNLQEFYIYMVNLISIIDIFYWSYKNHEAAGKVPAVRIVIYERGVMRA